MPSQLFLNVQKLQKLRYVDPPITLISLKDNIFCKARLNKISGDTVRNMSSSPADLVTTTLLNSTLRIPFADDDNPIEY